MRLLGIFVLGLTIISLIMPPSAGAQQLTVSIDPATRVKIGIPISIMGQPTTQQWGQNWLSSDRRLSIDTINFGAEALEERYKKISVRKSGVITRNLLDKNHFILEGRDKGANNNESLFYVEMHSSGGEIRGLSVVYSATRAAELKPIVDKVIASFEAFPKPVIAQPDRNQEKLVQEGNRKIQELIDKIEERDRRLTDVNAKVRLLENQPQATQREQEFRSERDRLLGEKERVTKQRDDLQKNLEDSRSERAKLQTRISELQKKVDELSKPVQGGRLALVIGNNKYTNLPQDKQLERAVNDSKAIGAALEDIGFTVRRGENLDLQEMEDLIRDFTASIKEGDISVVFFAGHGVAIAGANYLLPSDVKSPGPNSEARLRKMAISEADIVAELQRKKSVSVIVLDACRDNPFRAPGLVRAITGGERGLARSIEAVGIFAIYSAGYNQTALESLGPTDNVQCSVFTRALVGKLYDSHNTHLAEIIIDVREEVAKRAQSVGHQQYPAYYDQTQGGRIFLGIKPPSTIAPIGAGGGRASCA